MSKMRKLNVHPLEIEEYDFAYINCFIRAISIEVERMRPGMSNYFIFFNNFSRSLTNVMYDNYDYKPSKVRGHLINPDIEEELYFLNFILNNFFGLQLTAETSGKKSLYQSIKENIQKNKATIIPVNPSILYYCDYYKEKDWIHWLYCNGYNDEKDLVLVEDHVQFGMENTNYRPFKFSSETINQLHNSYNEVWVGAPSQNKIYVLDSISNSSKIYNAETFLIELKKMISKKLNEKKLINYIEESAFFEGDFDLIFSFKHFKTVYNNILIQNLRNNGSSNLEIDVIYDLGEQIKNEWDKLARTAKISELRNKDFSFKDYSNSLQNVKDKELKYLLNIYEAI